MCLFFFKQKTAYEMRISDWSSDVCSSDLLQVLVDDEDRLAPALHVADGGPDLAADDRRQALGRLVEDQQARVGHEGAADGQHLLLAAGERAGDLSGALAEAREERRDALHVPEIGRAHV